MVYGHQYNSQSNTYDHATSILGNLGAMCKFPKIFQRRSGDSTGRSQSLGKVDEGADESSAAYTQPTYLQPSNQAGPTPPPSEGQGLGDTDTTGIPSSADPTLPPPEYRERDPNWYIPGRLLKIWAPKDHEIDKKEFVLLDSKNVEGPGLLVRVYSQEDKQAGYFYRAHVLVRPPDPLELQSLPGPPTSQPFQKVLQGATQEPKTVYLDPYEVGNVGVEKATWVELEHTYNIPFIHHKCVDCGVLSRASLKRLRVYYLNYLYFCWDLTGEKISGI